MKWVDLKNFWVWIGDGGVHGDFMILMFGSRWLWVISLLNGMVGYSSRVIAAVLHGDGLFMEEKI